MADHCSFDSPTAIRLWNDEYAREPHCVCGYSISTSSRLQPLAVHRCPTRQPGDRAGNRARSRVVPGTLLRSAEPRYSARSLLDTSDTDSNPTGLDINAISNSDNWSQSYVYANPNRDMVADRNGDSHEHLNPNAYCDAVSILNCNTLWSTSAHRACQPSSEHLLVLESIESLYVHDVP